MDIIVRKYGGSSVAGVERMRHVAVSLAAAHRMGPLVVVVSAQGDTTDRLLDLAREVTGALADQADGPVSYPPSRETDQLLATGECASAALLAMALRAAGVDAVSLTGPQAGIRASGPPGEGRIDTIDTGRIEMLLRAGRAVVVAGFQATTQNGDVLTLGRGGSDTTAVGLAVALGARRGEIYTDVDGVYTADPRVVPTARRLPVVDVDVMVEMAFAGAKVLHSRSVELAAAHDVDLHVLSSMRDGTGTVVTRGGEEPMLESYGVKAVAHDFDVARVLVRCERGRRDPAVAVLDVLGRQHAPVDLVARSGPFEDEFRMGFTMRRSDLPAVEPQLRAVAAEAHGEIVVDRDVAKVSLVGIGLLNRPALTARLLTTLAGAGIATGWIATSQLRTSAIVPASSAADAVALLHKEFELDAGAV